MKTFAVIPANYGATYTFQAEEIDLARLNNELVPLKDGQGKVVAIISLKNVAAVFQKEDE